VLIDRSKRSRDFRRKKDADKRARGCRYRTNWRERDSPLPARVPLRAPGAKQELQPSARPLNAITNEKGLLAARPCSKWNAREWDWSTAESDSRATPIVPFWLRSLCLRRAKTEQAPTILTMKSARCSRQRRTITIGPSARPQLLVNGSVARCSMRGIHWIEPVTDRLPTSGHAKTHPTSAVFKFPLRVARVTLRTRSVDYRSPRREVRDHEFAMNSGSSVSL